MSQAELDALLAGEATTTPAESTFEDDGPMSQADLDALLAGHTPATPGESAPEDDAPMSQADLDALVNALESGTAAKSGGASASTEADNTSLSQDDLDALLGGINNEVTAADDEPLSQDDLDALLSGLDSAASAAAPSTSGPALLSQADLDALLATEAGGHERSLSQEALDTLLAAATDKGSAATEATSSDHPLALSQEDLDALLAGVADEGTARALDRPLDHANIDALLSDTGDDQALDQRALDGALGDFGEGYDDDISLSRSSIDSLMADLDSSGMLGPPPESAGGKGDDDDEIGEISQDMIDSLIANAQAQSSGSSAPASMSEIGSENFAAAATVSKDSGPELLSQSDLDRLIEESRQQDKARSQAKQRALEEAINSAQSAARSGGAPDLLAEIQAVKQRPPRKPSPTLAYLRENGARVAASLLMGGLAAMGTGVLLHVNREVVRDASSPQATPELEVALERARDYVDEGNYPAAIAALENPVARAMPGATKNDALYVLLEAKYRSRPGEYGTDAFDDMTAAIDSTVAEAPTHARAPEALAWRAQLFAKDDPKAALDTYDRIFDQYADAPGLDKMLIDASKLALAQNDPLTSAIYAQDLLRRFPASEYAGEAILAVGDANLIAGNEADARSTFVRIAESEPDTGLGAQAFMRLGRLAYDTGQYGQAIMQLEKRLETTTTTEGNDEVYLLLAQSYRKAGQLNEARDTLNDLLNIFEPGPVTPRAYIEYSQVLEALGDRDKAVRTAQRAAMEYPNDPAVLRNNGELLGLSGNPFAAADALVAADRAGAADPNLLLTAARYYRAANMPDEAAEIYERVKINYGGTPAALAGGVEAAQLRYAEGDAEGALNDLEALQAATRGSEHYLATLQAMQQIYQDLGLTEHIRALGREIVQQAQAPDLLAQTAINLIDVGDLESAQRAIESIDMAKLQEPVAFRLLMKEGTALLAVAPQRGLEKMEEAHFNYPEARTREADQLLLRTYLDTGRPAAARRLVMELKAEVANKPSDAPYLVDAAIAWGDYLYGKEDYRTAIFAYALAEEVGLANGQPVAGLRSHPDWAQYQRANALLRLADYQGCIALYDTIATSDSNWAGEAAVKAGLARLEQRQRGIEVPLPTQAQAPNSTPAG
jgi:TolA-binding protein